MLNIRQWLTRALGAVAAGLVLSLGAGAAQAVPITYIYAGVAEGNMNGMAFAAEPFVITATADTANIGTWCCSPLQNTHSGATVAMPSFGLGSFTGATHSWIAPNCCLGFGANLGINYLTLVDPAIVNVGYGLATAIGPLPDPNATTQGQFNGVGTTLGALTFTNVSQVTFQAVVVPEPATMLMWAGGLGGLVAFANRRSRQRHRQPAVTTN